MIRPNSKECRRVLGNDSKWSTFTLHIHAVLVQNQIRRAGHRTSEDLLRICHGLFAVFNSRSTITFYQTARLRRARNKRRIHILVIFVIYWARTDKWSWKIRNGPLKSFEVRPSAT